MSHDLRLIYIVGQTLLRKKAHEFNTKNRLSDEIEVSGEITELFKKVVYAVGLDANQNHSGTRENTVSGLPHKIQNVVDAEKALRELVLNKKFVKINNDKYHNKKNRLGTLHIYADGTQMKFEK
jgi:division protein CdvB (Snf7/Vps24/ESCRT-III family)